jgi:hypothetical protein
MSIKAPADILLNRSVRGCEINCVNGHRNVSLLLKGIDYGQTDTAGKTQAGID